MDEVLLLKFTQHPSLKLELLSTGDLELIEVRRASLCVTCFHELIMHTIRTLLWTHSGGSERMVKVAMSWARLSSDSGINFDVGLPSFCSFHISYDDSIYESHM